MPVPRVPACRIRARLLAAGAAAVLLWLLASSAVVAGNSPFKLALEPIGQPGTYFDLTMRPGERQAFAVRVANDGNAALKVRTYAADVYTIVNGGFGGRLHDLPRTGTTTWLDYPSAAFQLEPGAGVERRFAVVVPADAAAGEYITSLVVENAVPIIDPGPVGLDQIVRDAVAVVITVPGPRAPAMAIGGATHKVVGGTSTVSIAVSNTGNVRLKPTVAFTLFDASGVRVSQATLQMGTSYAQTSTAVEFPLAALLAPGSYTVELSLADALQGVAIDKAGIPLLVDVLPTPPSEVGIVPGLIDVVQGAAGGSWALAILACLVSAGIVCALACVEIVRRRRRHATDKARPIS